MFVTLKLILTLTLTDPNPNPERLHGQTVKALANHFGGPKGSIPRMGCRERETVLCEIFAPVPDAALNDCELHVKPDLILILILTKSVLSLKSRLGVWKFLGGSLKMSWVGRHI